MLTLDQGSIDENGGGAIVRGRTRHRRTGPRGNYNATAPISFAHDKNRCRVDPDPRGWHEVSTRASFNIRQQSPTRGPSSHVGVSTTAATDPQGQLT